MNYWEIETENTIKALEMLRTYTNKPVVRHDIKELASDPETSHASSHLGVLNETPVSIDVYLSEKSPEESFIHEIFHQILECEGFPQVSINEDFVEDYIDPLISGNEQRVHYVLRILRNDFSSTIGHPEVYKRMSSFPLDFEAYFEIEYNKKLERFQKGMHLQKSDEQYYFYRQQDILIGCDYLLWGDQGKKLFKKLLEYYPDTHSSFLSLHKDIVEIGFATPETAFQSAKLIKEHIIKYGKRRGLKNKYNRLWEALEIRL